jgi:hypothetical protein
MTADLHYLSLLDVSERIRRRDLSRVDRNGMPLGLQLAGPHLSEALLCRAGHAFQQATDFHTAHPVLER